MFDDAPDGTPVAAQTSGDCAEIVCDGAGKAKVVARTDDIADDGKVCTIDACDGMTPTHTVQAGVACYTGPAATKDVGLCVGGTQACDAQGVRRRVRLERRDVRRRRPGPDERLQARLHAGGVRRRDRSSGRGRGERRRRDERRGHLLACVQSAGGDNLPAVDLGAGGAAVAITSNFATTCAIVSGGGVKCWGRNDYGQLGLGDKQDRGDDPNEMGDNLPAVARALMIYITQLIYLREGGEVAFNTFEDTALRLLSKYRGELVLRLRPGAGSKIDGSAEAPHEVHVVRFESDEDLARYSMDEERQRLLPYKEQSIRSAIVIKGDLI